MADDDVKDRYRRLVAIFLNFPTDSYRQRDLIKNTGFPDGTIKSFCHKFKKKGLIRGFSPEGKRYFRYMLKDHDLAYRYLKEPSFNCTNKRGYTPSPHPRDYLATMIPQEEHHKFYQIKLTEQEFARTEHLFSKSKPNDRGKNRTYEARSYKINVSQNTLNGVIYLLDTDWKQRLMDTYPDLCDALCKKIELENGHLGVSIDAESWAGFKLSDEFLTTIFASSHYWKELDFEGKEKYVNSMLQNIVKTSQEKTTFEATISILMKELLTRTDRSNEQSVGMLAILQQLSDRLDKGNDLQERSIVILETLVNGKKKEDEPDKPVKELDEHDLIMFA